MSIAVPRLTNIATIVSQSESMKGFGDALHVAADVDAGRLISSAGRRRRLLRLVTRRRAPARKVAGAWALPAPGQVYLTYSIFPAIAHL